MGETAARAAGPQAPVKGSSIVAAIKAAGADIIVALPDIVTCETVLWPIARDPSLRLVQVCKEDEGVSICAALSYCERRAVLLIQHTGFLDSINAIRAIAAEYRLPVIMVVGLQGHAPGQSPAQSDKLGLRILLPVIEAMEIEHTILDLEADASAIADTIDRSYETSAPHVFLVTRSPA